MYSQLSPIPMKRLEEKHMFLTAVFRNFPTRPDIQNIFCPYIKPNAPLMQGLLCNMLTT